MKIKLIIVIAFVAAAMLTPFTKVKAQTITPHQWQAIFGAEAGITTGGGGVPYNSRMLGGTAGVQYGIKENLAFTITTGFYNFLGPSYAITGNSIYRSSDVNFIPVKVGLKWFITKGLYASAEAGAAFGLKGNDIRIIMSPGVGYKFSSLDVGVRFENMTNFGSNKLSFAAFHLAYGFKL